MATYIVKQLQSGVLAGTEGAIYTVPSTRTAIIKAITLVNLHTTQRVNLNLFIQPANGTARRIIPVDMELESGFSLETDVPYTLAQGDAIRANAFIAGEPPTPVSGVIEFTINGVEETA